MLEVPIGYLPDGPRGTLLLHSPGSDIRGFCFDFSRVYVLVY